MGHSLSKEVCAGAGTAQRKLYCWQVLAATWGRAAGLLALAFQGHTFEALLHMGCKPSVWQCCELGGAEHCLPLISLDTLTRAAGVHGCGALSQASPTCSLEPPTTLSQSITCVQPRAPSCRAPKGGVCLPPTYWCSASGAQCAVHVRACGAELCPRSAFFRSPAPHPQQKRAEPWSMRHLRHAQACGAKRVQAPCGTCAMPSAPPAHPNPPGTPLHRSPVLRSCAAQHAAGVPTPLSRTGGGAKAEAEGGASCVGQAAGAGQAGCRQRGREGRWR